MKNGLLYWLATATALFISATASAQGTVSGKVLDAATQQPVIGAVVSVQGSAKGTVADIDGNFSLTVSDKFPFDLRVSYIGYEDEELTVYEPSEGVEIYLSEQKNAMDEIVVVGYAQAVKSSLTSAISQLKPESLKAVASATLGNKLQGAVPGLLISSSSGVPGTSQAIRLRGATSISAANTPIYIIDGTIVNTDVLQSVDIGGQGADPLADINPDDIEKITVLKDASATAAYGAKGANGVILIETKRGATGEPTRLNVKSEWGWSRTSDLWDLVSGPEHATVVNQAWLNDGGSYETRPFRPVSEAAPGYPAYGNPEDQPTYDRISDVFRTAFQHSYNISLSGGSDKTNFFIGGEYTKQEATLKLQDFERFGFRLNLDHQVAKKVKIGTSNIVSFTDRSLVRTGDGPSGFFQAALHTPTFYPVFKEDGSYNKPVAFDNHQAMLDHYDAKAKGLRLNNSVYLKLDLAKGLTFKSSLGNDHSTYHELFYYDSFLISGQPNGSATDATTTKNIFSAEQLFNFLHTFGEKHTTSAFLGTAFHKNRSESVNVNGKGYPSDQLRRITSSATQTGSTSGSTSAVLSFFGGINYSFDNRYSIDFTARADGSSRVGKNKRWGFFPALGGSWNISNESFFSKNDVISNLRLKTSIGLSGNDNIGDFASLSLWSGGRNYNGQAGIAPSRLGNPDLTWETTRQWNIGVQFNLIKERLDVELNYYDKYTTDLLLAETVPGKTGFSSVTTNSGEVSNKGLEFILQSQNVKSRRFSWNSTLTLSHNKNVVEKLPVDVTGGYQMFKLFEGKPLYSMWVYEYLGVDPQTGDAIYRDVNQDGKITVDDKVVVGDAWPNVEGSLRNVLSFGNLSLDFTFYFKQGNEIFNYTRMFLESGGTRGVTRSMQSSTLNYWKNPGDTGVLPRPKSKANADGSFNYEGQSSRVVEDASFLRLRNVTLAYALPRRAVHRLHADKASLYFTVSNVFLVSKYSGPDPEVNLEGESPNGLVQGMDFGTPPQPRTALIGLNITF